MTNTVKGNKVSVSTDFVVQCIKAVIDKSSMLLHAPADGPYTVLSVVAESFPFTNVTITFESRRVAGKKVYYHLGGFDGSETLMGFATPEELDDQKVEEVFTRT